MQFVQFPPDVLILPETHFAHSRLPSSPEICHPPGHFEQDVSAALWVSMLSAQLSQNVLFRSLLTKPLGHD